VTCNIVILTLINIALWARKIIVKWSVLIQSFLMVIVLSVVNLEFFNPISSTLKLEISKSVQQISFFFIKIFPACWVDRRTVVQQLKIGRHEILFKL
jgi:hypothetical protein